MLPTHHFLRRRRHRPPQSKRITVDTEAANLSLHDFGEHRMMAKRFTRVDVRHMNLDDGYRQYGERIANSIAVVRPCAGIDQHAIDFIDERLMDSRTHV